MAGYYELPERVGEVVNRIDPQAASSISAYWSMLMLLIQVGGIILVMHSLYMLHKKYKYQRPDYGDYKLATIVLGVIMVNMNHFIEMVFNTVFG